ncbi:MAG: DNA mismatch repair protein MutS [Phycisphaerae bacterium]|nr:DNA mismatch repair protein MutS [Phycisphaerae bacterium]
MTQTTAGKKRSKPQNNPWSTPAMKQYRSMKEAHPDCVLFFRMGDFYEMFDEDARVVSKAIGLSLTQRGNGLDMAGVPHHAAESYMRKMVDAGFRVAVCEQLEDPAQAKGVVKRGVTRVVTPGTLVDESLLDETKSNLLGAMHRENNIVSIALAELSTGWFELHQCEAHRVGDVLQRLGLSEIILDENDKHLSEIATRFGISITMRPSWMFLLEEGTSILTKQFGVSTVEGFGLATNDSRIGPAGALLSYIKQTQSQHGELSHLRTPFIKTETAFVNLDATTLRSLEIEHTIRGNSVEGSLLWVMQRCKTAMGKRLLRQWLCEPLACKSSIEQRQQIVKAFVEDAEMFRNTQTILDRIQDIARIAGRLSMGRVTPRDIVALGSSIHVCEELADSLAHPALLKLKDTLKTLADNLMPLANSILSQCIESPPAHMREGGLFRNGIDAVLDEARMLQKDAGTWLAQYQARLTEETSINTIKVGFNKIFGYYIEVTHAQTSNVPDTFTRKQTLKNAERYITPELKEFENKVLSAESKAITRELEMYSTLCQLVSINTSSIISFADAVATLDTLICFSDVANRFNYVQPTLVDEPVIRIEGGRHPVLDRLLQDSFVPNNCSLDGNTLALITGPNMAGKSTYIRQVALITLLAHTGSFVPATSATIGMVDRIFTRVGASDELHSGHSTFMVEMVETANILNNASEKSLVILDEIGRGTSTLDGLSLAWAITEHLATRGCRTLFATHYHELTSLAEQNSPIVNLHVTVKEWKDEIVFLYGIQEGKTDRSYGIHVAKIAGVPAEVVNRANDILDTLTVHTHHEDPTIPPPQMSLFTEYLPSPIVDELKNIDINSMSPIEAFELLRELNRCASDEDAH